MTPEQVIEEVGALARERGVEAYAVGGYVRDRELGLPFRDDMDFSIVGDAPAFARAMAERLPARGRVAVYRRFGTAAFTLKSGLQLEFATSRRESYSPESRNPDVEPAPFREDLARRDFTINALAVDARAPDRLVDPFGGLQDLQARLIRTPRDPFRTFDDDPLRILRAVRFAARLGFRIHEQTWEAMAHYRQRLAIVARERINDEFFKTLAVDRPSRGMRLLQESGVMEVVFPEIAALAGVEQVGRHHHKDVFNHSLVVLDNAAAQTDRLDIRFAALVHDIGKPATKHFDPEAGWTFHGHEHVGERLVKKMGRRYKLGEDFTARVAHLTRMHMRPKHLQDEGVTDSAIRRLVVQAGEDLDGLLALCRADVSSGNERKVRRLRREFDRLLQRIADVEQKDALRAFQSPIRGEEIMERTGLREGPRVGLIKALIEEAILEGDIPNSTEGAERIFGEVVDQVRALPDDAVLKQLRSLSRARQEGQQPPDSSEEG